MSRKCSNTGVRFYTFVTLTLLVNAQSPSVSIRVLEGAGALNSIKLHRGFDPVVQVVSGSGEPIGGATVTFLLPASGPSATFGDNSLSQTVQTDARGMATAHGLKPNRLEGQFRIRVTTSWRGESAATTLVQTNAEPPGKSSSSKWAVIALIVGGAAAGGVVAATHGGNSPATTPTPPVPAAPASSIVPGAPSFGPPK